MAKNRDVAFRASMLPIGNYDDGSVAFPVWPQGAVDAYNAIARFHRGEPPQPEDAVLAGLVMGGAGFAPRAAAAARASAQVSMVDPLVARAVEARAPAGASPAAVSRPPAFEPRNPRNIGDEFSGTPANDPKSAVWTRDYPQAPATEAGDEYIQQWLVQQAEKSWDGQNAWDRLAAMGFEFSPMARDSLRRSHMELVANEKKKDLLNPGTVHGDGNFGDPVRSFMDHYGPAPWWFDPDTGASKVSPTGHIGSPDPRFQKAWQDYEANLPRNIRPGADPNDMEGFLIQGLPGDYLFSNAPEAAPAGMLPSMANSAREAGSAPYSARVYRGAAVPEQWPPTDPRFRRFFASDNPDVTNEYTSAGHMMVLKGDAPHAPSVTPADVNFRNPLVVDAQGRGYPEIPWQGGIIDTESLAAVAREQGHDGLVVKNVRDGGGGDHPAGPPSTVVVGLGRGTVRSATTGETLFSNPKEAAPAGLVTSVADAPSGWGTAGEYAAADIPFRNRSGSGVGWLTDEPRTNPFPGHARIVRDPESPTGAHVWPHDLTERELRREQGVRAAPDLWSNPKEAAPAGALSAGNTMPSNFDQAFAELDAALIDLDGDGVPDVAVPQQSNAMAGYAQAGQTQPTNAMAGSSFPQMVANNPRGWGNAPPVPEATLSNATPTVGENAMSFFRQQGPIGERIAPVAGAVLDYGPIPAQETVGQLNRNADAVVNAARDPTLANVTNAGMQTAVTLGRPVAAAGMLGAGMLEGARRDYAPDVFSPANALTRKQRHEQEKKDREAAREREAELARIKAQSEAKRLEGDAAAARELEAERKRKEQEEYNRAVANAEGARDTELARKRRFSDTEMGKVYDKAGGFAPILAGVGMGAAGRLAHGDNAMGRYILPALEGAGATLAATSAPLLYDYQTDSDNPEKAAYLAYARELPQGHPRKQEFLNYANSLPDRNPVQQNAEEQFFNPARLGMSALEGALGGIGGSTLASVPARGGNAMATWMRGGRGPTGPTAPPGYGAPRSTYTPPATPPRPPPRPVVGSDGRTRYHDPDTGDFTSGPER